MYILWEMDGRIGGSCVTKRLGHVILMFLELALLNHGHMLHMYNNLNYMCDYELYV